MAKIDTDSKKIIIGFVILIIVVSFSQLMYFNSKLTSVQKDTNTKLLLLNKDILIAMNQLESNLDEEITATKNNLSLDIEMLDTRVTSYRKENEQQVETFSELVKEIETQSNIKLDELKQDISSIQVQSADFSGIIDDILPSVVSVGTNRGQGSGVAVAEDGFIITNYHVIEGASIIRILTSAGKVYDAQAIAINDELDLALIKAAVDLEYLDFADSDDVKAGEKVIALGNPAGLSFSVAEGIISAVNRKGPNGLSIYLQTDVPINPGNSGGPLVDVNSEVVGINNFKIGGFEGLGFAIESNTVKDFVDDALAQYRAAQQ